MPFKTKAQRAAYMREYRRKARAKTHAGTLASTVPPTYVSSRMQPGTQWPTDGAQGKRPVQGLTNEELLAMLPEYVRRNHPGVVPHIFANPPWRRRQ
jgi:hypothetical protein